YVIIGTAEAAAGGRTRRSILADCFEAVIAAVFLDRGIRTARRVVIKRLTPAMREVLTDLYRRDYKSTLQEVIQAQACTAPTYVIVRETGEEHDKTFIAQALAGAEVLGEGAGKSKKQAEQAAAHAALQRLKPLDR
ncbi:MAG TPA: putative dsRNA-binding protein, partial [Chthonomonadales bacterium]|nr:putative dsRNA-binding protein [Chthonomonadales bacterium]